MLTSFFKPLADQSDAAVQAKRLLAQSAAQVQKEAAQRQKAALLKPGRGRPKKAVDAFQRMEAAPEQEEQSESAAKRGKYNNWSATL